MLDPTILQRPPNQPRLLLASSAVGVPIHSSAHRAPMGVTTRGRVVPVVPVGRVLRTRLDGGGGVTLDLQSPFRDGGDHDVVPLLRGGRDFGRARLPDILADQLGRLNWGQRRHIYYRNIK